MSNGINWLCFKINSNGFEKEYAKCLEESVIIAHHSYHDHSRIPSRLYT